MKIHEIGQKTGEARKITQGYVFIPEIEYAIDLNMFRGDPNTFPKVILIFHFFACYIFRKYVFLMYFWCFFAVFLGTTTWNRATKTDKKYVIWSGGTFICPKSDQESIYQCFGTIRTLFGVLFLFFIFFA